MLLGATQSWAISPDSTGSTPIGAAAQPAPIIDPGSAPSPAAAPTEAPADMLTVPALTLLTLRIDSEITSKTAKRGDRFGLTMLNEISIDGVVVIPRGSRGEGEVIHAAGTGFGGRAGELIVAARFLMVGGEKLPLQSFRLGNAGVNNANAAIILAAGAGVIGAVASMFVTGTSAHIDAGHIAIAKTATAFSVPRPAAITTLTLGSTEQ
ncbi:MAG: hypothetical protein H7268_14750 [Sandarakinorhabdus sp.]|nr:hypothetical protein [Sandarakinorhabdus sp.]